MVLSPLPLCPQYSSMGTTGCGPPKVASSIGEGREDLSSHFLSQPMVWQQPKVGLQKSCVAKECRKSPLVWFICLKEFYRLSSLFQIPLSWYKRSGKQVPLTPPALRTNGHGLWKCYARLGKCYWLSCRNYPPIQLQTVPKQSSFCYW